MANIYKRHTHIMQSQIKFFRFLTKDGINVQTEHKRVEKKRELCSAILFKRNDYEFNIRQKLVFENSSKTRVNPFVVRKIISNSNLFWVKIEVIEKIYGNFQTISEKVLH